jgi:IS605 OrfB family transposase
MKTLKIKLKLTYQQREIIDNWIYTYSYVYNNTVEKIEKGNPVNFIDLRDLLVTNNTKKNHIEYKTISDKIKLYHNKKKKIMSKITNLLKYYKQRKILEEKFKLVKTIEGNKDCINKLYNLSISNETKYSIPLLNYKLNKFNLIIKEKNKLLRIVAKTLLTQQNTNIKKWELKTPKEIRAGAVNEACNAYKSNFEKLKNHQIRYFKMHYKKKTEPNKNILIPKSFLKIIDNKKIQIAPNFFKNHSILDINIRKNIKNKNEFYKNFEIKHDCNLIKQKNMYWLCVPISIDQQITKKVKNYCGIYPVVRTFMTIFSNNGSYEYNHNKKKINKINKKIDILKRKKIYTSKDILLHKIKKLENMSNKIPLNKSKIIKSNTLKLEELKKKINKKHRNSYRKRTINKYESKKENIINEIHYKTINDLIKTNDYIFYGDIKSHNIVKNNKNHNLNRDINDLKFYLFKQRLQYKAHIANKVVYLVNESFTTQTCSFCGNINKNVESSKIYKCLNQYCNKHIGRDINAAKNILMKGIITNL